MGSRGDNRTVRRVEGARLVYYARRSDARFWNQLWSGHLDESVYRGWERGDLGWFEKPFCAHLPRGDRILEGGCGMGQIVVALRARGYDCEGVDFAAETVEAVRALRADLPIRVGDLLRLDVPDGHYGGYISLGVVEHRREGPEPYLAEAHRVLRDGGSLLISVPHFNRLRRLRARLGCYRADPGEREFYQFAYRAAEMRAILAGAGFEVLEEFHYDGVKGLREEILPLRPLLRTRIGHRGARWLLRHAPWAEALCAHMVLFACRKVSGAARQTPLAAGAAC